MIVFNTMRPYSRHGQRIAADFHTDDTIVFVDVDRGIAGVIDPLGFNDDLTQHNVMHDYDHCTYTPAGPEHADLIKRLSAAARHS
jgi:hypothetical protein